MADRIGIDIGGTNIKVGLVRRGKVIKMISVPAGPDMVKRIIQAVDSIRSKRPVERIGIGCAGLVDPEKGLVYYSPNIEEFKDLPLARIIEDYFHIHTTILNDVNGFLYGEFRFGAGKGYNNLIGLTVGTGVGGAAIIEGQMLWGSGYMAGEFGHMVIKADGPLCSCGRRGCLEIMASQTRIIRMAKRCHLRMTDPRGVAFLARRGERRAMEIYDEIGRSLAIGIGNLINIFDPEVVIIGGGIAKAGPVLFGPIKRYLKGEVMGYRYRNFQIKKAKLDSAANLLGPAYFNG